MWGVIGLVFQVLQLLPTRDTKAELVLHQRICDEAAAEKIGLRIGAPLIQLR
jgi:hypothetical protein